MNRKTIQEQRRKGYFIDAAKDIIKNEGFGNLTVKKIADRAGFAPGTLYNYFENLNELYVYCAADFWEECRETVINKVSEKENIKEKIIDAAKAYCEYFIDNPQVFQLIFLKDLEDIPQETPGVVLLLTEQLEEGFDKGLIAEDKLKHIENILSNFMHGLLLFYIKQRTGLSREQILKMLEDEILFLLKEN